ncbi:hypothetical protein ACFFW8_17080 [Erwinia tracheiphila]
MCQSDFCACRKAVDLLNADMLEKKSSRQQIMASTIVLLKVICG